MRVMQILPELQVGGVETGTVDFAKYLQRHGHYNIVVSHGGRMVAELERHGIPHYTLPVHKKNLFTAWKAVSDVRALIIRERIDIVHARSRVPAWIAYFACRGTSAQFITTCHGHYSVQFFSRVMGFPKLIIVPSRVIGRHMIDAFHVAPEAVRCIPRSVDQNRFKRREQEALNRSYAVVTIVGRLSPIKGHTYFLKAMAKVVRSMPYVRVRIVGDVAPHKESYRQELEVLTRHLGLVAQVEFLGDRQDVPEILAESDVLVMASVVPEAFGRVILEAQAVGVPVVATDVGGVGEVIEHGKTGLLVLPRDTDAMAQAVLRILNEPKLAREMVAAAWRKIDDQYTLEHMASRTVGVYEELLNRQNILVIKLGALGDVVLITASLKALRKKFPQAKISCLVGEASKEVLQKCASIDEMIVVDLKGRHRGWLGVIAMGRRLAQCHFDRVVDFQNNARSHVLAALTGAVHTYGFRNRKLGFLLTDPVEQVNDDLPPVEHQFQILKLLGIEYQDEVALDVSISERDRKRAQELLAAEWITDGVRMVGMNVAASPQWVTKNWPAASMARLCDLLASRNLRVALTGTDKDRATAQEVLRLSRSKPADLTGKTTIMELCWIIKRCEAYVSPDSCPLHLAAAMRTPFVALFGPTSSRRHLPPGRGVVHERSMACAPCYEKFCKEATHACMTSISPEEVADSIYSFVSKEHGRGEA